MATELRGERIVLSAQRVEKPDERYPSRFNPRTQGLAPTEVVWMVSEDQGRTWTPPSVPRFEGAGKIDANCNLLELKNGNWFWPYERWKAWDDDAPLHIKGFGLLSTDRGKSWKKAVDFPSSNDSERIYSHTKYAGKKDGRVCALQWTTRPGMIEDYDLHYVEADTSCGTWVEPRSTGIPGQNSWILDPVDGAMAATVAVGENETIEPGVYAFFSDDDGVTWNHDAAVQLWPACAREWEQFRKNSDSLFKVAFGQVAIAQDVDGGILCAWRCFDDRRETCIRYAQFES